MVYTLFTIHTVIASSHVNFGRNAVVDNSGIAGIEYHYLYSVLALLMELGSLQKIMNTFSSYALSSGVSNCTLHYIYLILTTEYMHYYYAS